MFKREDNDQNSLGGSNETIIAHGVKVDGNFSSEGNIVIDGELHGTIETKESLRIGQSAVIHADISAKQAIIAGEVEGNITIKGVLELLETSNITGDIEAEVLSVSSGAKINGKVSMQRALEPARVQKKEEIIEKMTEEAIAG
ncbi:MAG: polymer-forming cytoskeletal protein [Patescibacteria group bacterium]